MKNVIRVSAACLVLALTSCTKEKAIDDELKEAAANMNKLTPQVLSDGIRFDSVTTGSKTLKYNYTLTEDTKEQVTPEEIGNFKQEAKNGALNSLKTSADMQDLKDYGVTFKYSYYDKNGKPLTDFTVSPEEYKGKEK